jgi:hypothetical protein
VSFKKKATIQLPENKQDTFFFLVGARLHFNLLKYPSQFISYMMRYNTAGLQPLPSLNRMIHCRCNLGIHHQTRLPHPQLR